MYEFKKKLESYLRVNLLGPGPRLMKKEFTGPAEVLQNVEKYCTRSHELLYKEIYFRTQFGFISVWRN